MGGTQDDRVASVELVVKFAGGASGTASVQHTPATGWFARVGHGSPPVMMDIAEAVQTVVARQGDAAGASTVSQEDEWVALLAKAAKLGNVHGTIAGKDLDITSRAQAWALLNGIDDCDSAIMDTLPSADLSGQWAGDYGMSNLYDDLDVTAEDDSDDLELCDVYERGFSAGVENEIGRRARRYLGRD